MPLVLVITYHRIQAVDTVAKVYLPICNKWGQTREGTQLDLPVLN
jgi:hypothetical protein